MHRQPVEPATAIGLVCAIIGLGWVLGHIAPSYDLKLSGRDSKEERKQLVVCETSWWGISRHCFPVRFAGDDWEIYKDRKWKNGISSEIEYAVTAGDEIIGTQFPPDELKE